MLRYLSLVSESIQMSFTAKLDSMRRAFHRYSGDQLSFFCKRRHIGNAAVAKSLTRRTCCRSSLVHETELFSDRRLLCFLCLCLIYPFLIFLCVHEHLFILCPSVLHQLAQECFLHGTSRSPSLSTLEKLLSTLLNCLSLLHLAPSLL